MGDGILWVGQAAGGLFSVLLLASLSGFYHAPWMWLASRVWVQGSKGEESVLPEWLHPEVFLHGKVGLVIKRTRPTCPVPAGTGPLQLKLLDTLQTKIPGG